MTRRVGQSALLAYQGLLDDPTVQAAVKEILKREYPPDTELFPIFIEHSHAVACKAFELARRCGAEAAFVWEAAWLHDIGIKYTHAPGIACRGTEHYLRHGVIGREICDRAGLPKHGLVCERHVGTGLAATEIAEQNLPLPHRDMLCQTLEERVVCYADQFFSKSQTKPRPQEEVEGRVRRHGEGPWARFCEMQAEFGHLS